MDKISSKWRPQKSRPSKRKQKYVEKARKRWEQKNICDIPSKTRSEDEILHADPQTRPSTSSSVEPSPSEPQNSISFSSVSENKLSLFSANACDKNLDSCYLLVHSSTWNVLVGHIKCDECGQMELNVDMGEKMGLVCKLKVVCKNCGVCFGETYTSPRTKTVGLKTQRPPFDINKKTVDAFLGMGAGYRKLEQFCMSVGMNVMDSKTFTRHMGMLADENKLLRNEVLQQSRIEVRKAHENVTPSFEDQDVIDIAVSYDGTWHKRGYTSLYGIGVVIDILTGLVIDYEILSKYCPMCVTSAHELGEQSPEFNYWAKGHKESGECCNNYEGSSVAMEVHAADILWKRSESECKMRYTTVLSDGDAKTYLHLTKENVYGENVQIIKEECVNHISKRMGTGLRNLVQQWKAKDVKLGGRGAGSLKQSTIVKLTNYYRNAIISNIPDVAKMKSSIYATLHHYSSTDSKPFHTKCPPGPESWCFYNRSIAKGEVPQSHSTMSVQFPPSTLSKLIPLYQRLASNEILSRCTRGATQNANESLHASIWRKCPKENFVSKKRLDIATCNAIGEYNMGCSALQHLKTGVTQEDVPAASQEIAAKRNKRRIYDSKRSNSESKRISRMIKMRREEARKKEEGKSYGAGEF